MELRLLAYEEMESASFGGVTVWIGLLRYQFDQG